jgi:protein-tyrosine phosphatase
MHKVLFVCTGNICRSPTAEGVLRSHLERAGMAEKIIVDSAGTHGYHVDEAPDHRSIATAGKRGIMIDQLRARKVAAQDFHEFNVILGLDEGHVALLKQMAPPNAPAHVGLFLDYAGLGMKDVPDPYYGDQKGFEYVLDLVETAMPSLIEKLKADIS